jgi:2-C-methyl-D-erythritol 4-phosphate cytidylyltransferase
MAVALVVAAGSGERLGADRPKAFVVLAGRPMVEWSLDALRAAGIDDIVVALPPGHDPPHGTTGVEGGATRSESVRRALAASSGDPVVVHDAARPLLTPEIVERCIAGLDGADAAIAAARVTDTIKEAGEDGIVRVTHDRSRQWAVQTPQVFRREVLDHAFDVSADVLAFATDDAWLVERTGGTVRLVETTPANFKVTTPHDLRVAEMLLADRC